jgi:dTDP-4-amino-4,6-dideoxygalactose transaminase
VINWFCDFKKEYIELKNQLDFVYKQVMERGVFVLGREVSEFEREFAKFTGNKFCVSVGNGTDAIAISLKALNLPLNSKVLTTPLTATYSSLAIVMAGLTPVFVDIDDSFNLSLENYKTDKSIKALLAVHLYGNPCNMDFLVKYCVDNGLRLVEDCAQSHGAKYNSTNVGTFGDISSFSFYPTKNLGAYGDGGAVVTNNEDFAKICKVIREGGQTSKYFHDILGVNSRLDELQAGFLRVKLTYLEKWNARRKEIAQCYRRELSGVGDLRFPKVLEDSADPVYHIFALATKKRDDLASFLLDRGIKTAVHYPIPLHLQKCFSYLRYKKGDFPNAEKACLEVLSIPMHPFLTNIEVEEVIENIKKFWN